MIIRIPLRCEAQWLRVKAQMAYNLAESGIRTTGDEIHAHLIAALESVLHCGPGIVASDAAPVYEAHPRLPLPPYDPSRKAADQRDLAKHLRASADRLDRDAAEYYEAQAE